MTKDETVLYEKHGRVAWVTLNRPEVRNAIDPQTDEALRDVWSDFSSDDNLDVAVWTGAGESFCAGADRNTWIPQWVNADSLAVRHAAREAFGGLSRLASCTKPVIAAVNGPAIGGGLELALACDIRVASDRAVFGTPLVRFGFHSGDGGISRLIAICGLGVALDLQLTGETIDAERALQCNLVTRVVAHDNLLSEAGALAERLVASDQFAIRSAKETAIDVIGRRLDDQLRTEALNAYSLAARARDVVAAFSRG